jgi:D-3-phosphoglycerate dehydrogenase / 2-oxoglutarate reductase
VTSVLVLDSLFADLHVETETAAAQGAWLARWDGSDAGLAGADVVLHVRTRVDAALIAALPRCRAIGRFGTGLDTVDREAARAAGIAVVGVRDYCVPELPTHTLALAFALHRRLREIAGSNRSWEEVAAATPLRRGAHAAVIGLGNVGRRVAAALLALGYSVLPVTRTPALAHGLGLDPLPLADALRAADLIFLHAALDDSTRGMIDARRLELVRPHALLVDTARLGLLDETAVADALREQRLGGLALDARLEPDSPLAAFEDDPRVLISPHVGWYSQDAARALRAGAVTAAIEAAKAHEDEERHD